MLKVQFSAGPQRWEQFAAPLAAALDHAGLNADLRVDHPAPDVDYIVYAPGGGLDDFSPYTRAKAVFSLWAGVERIVNNPTLAIPLTRMVDAGLREGMVEYVCGHVLRHHLGMDRYILGTRRVWRPEVPPLARNRTVAVLGLGALGSAVATALATLNFRVLGWSRREKRLNNIECLHGEDGLRSVLEHAQILVLLLPDTAQTKNLLNAKTLALLPRGAVIINPGRGTLIDETALLNALDNGPLGHATLDVFRTEPLPDDHPFWAHPRITITPHIASETRAETASEVIAQNMRRSEAGEPLLYLVDRAAGY